MKTPNFENIRLWDRLCWAKENLEKVRTEYCIVWEDPDTPDAPAKVTHPDPNWMACALQGGILPPVWVYHELAKDEAQPGFEKHTRGYLLHQTKPIDAMTQEQAIEYLIQKDIPQRVWQDHERTNRPKFCITTRKNLPSKRTWRNAWKLDINNYNNFKEVA